MFFLFGNGKTENAEFFAELKVFAVCEGGKSCFVQTKLARGIEKLLVHADAHDVGDEHIV